jgi:mono/diheme cytochrome c family protein
MSNRKTTRILGALALLAALGLPLFWLVTKPRPLTADALPAHAADVANGETLYHAGGCHSCHLPTADSGIDPSIPAGGTPLKTPVGTLYPANLTPDPETGLGQWSDVDFLNAMQKGIGRGGVHLIPAFPYTSYARMSATDVLDIKAYLATLPATRNAVKPHEVLALPLVRFGLGGWKLLGFQEARTEPDPSQSEAWNRGRYLVDGPGHCNECHTPRNLFMASDMTRYLAGGPHPEGSGKVPSLRSLVERKRFKDAADLVLALQNGESFGYEHISAGGMGRVQTNIARLPEADVQAIAAYLVSLE